MQDSSSWRHHNDDSDYHDDDTLVRHRPLAESDPLINSTDVGSRGNSAQIDVPSSIFQVKDRFKIVYIVFIWLGLSGTVPWNFFVYAEEYWQYKLRDVNHTGPLDPTKRNALQTNFANYLNMAAMIPGLVGFVLCTMYSNRISLSLRIIGSSLIILLQFVVTAVLALIDTDSWQFSFFLLTMGCVVIMNGFNAVLQASTFGTAGRLHSKYIRAAMNGQAIGGILGSVVRILTLLHDETSVTVSALYFFCSATVVIAFCIVFYVVLVRNSYYMFHYNRTMVLLEPSINDKSFDFELKPSFKQVFHKVKIYAVSVTLLFVGTFAVYPAITVLVVSVNRQSGTIWTGKFFLPFACFLLFNCGDFCGRCVSGFIRVIPANSLIVPAICILRFSLVPLVLLCNVQPRTNFPVIFDNDVTFIILVTVIAVSNGYMASHCMTMGPTLVRKEHQELAGIVMSFFMALGVFLGALVALVLVQLL